LSLQPALGIVLRLKKLIHRAYMAMNTASQWFYRKLTPAGTLVVAMMVVSSLLGIDTYKTMSYQVFTFLMTLFIISLGYSFFSKVEFSIDRKTPPAATAGAPFKYSVLVTNNTSVPLDSAVYTEVFADPRPSLKEFYSMKVEKERNINAYDRFMGPIRWFEIIRKRLPVKPKDHDLPHIPPKGVVRLDIETTPRHRGYIRFEGGIIGAPDPFGLVKSIGGALHSQSIPVFPKIYKTAPIRLPGNRKYNQGGVSNASKVGDSEEFTGLRDYRPGDPLRYIHWRSWARTGNLVVKEHQSEFFSRHALAFDTFIDEDINELFEEAVSVAASFVFNTDTQDALLDLMFVGEQAYTFTSGRGLASTSNIMEILASVTPTTDKKFESLAESVLERLPILSGVICVLLDWDEPRQKFILHLVANCVPVKVVLVTESAASGEINPGPMKSLPHLFHVVRKEHVEEDLSKL